MAESIESVRGQYYQNWELLIVDDASTDGTAELAAASAARDPRISLISLSSHAGAAEARNVAIRGANGRYIAFLDADDIWFPSKLDMQVAFMQRDNVALSYTGFVRRMAGGARKVRVPQHVDYDRLLRGNVIGCLTAMYDAGQLGRLEMPPMRMRHDYALWLDILKRIPFAYGIEEPLAEHRERAGSLSANRLAAVGMTWRLYRQHEQLGAFKASMCLGSFLCRRIFN